LHRNKIFTLVAIIFLSFVALMHIVRIATGAEILINYWSVPMWLNGLGALITGSLAVMPWKENIKS
jgi:hypothetical protein